MGSSPRQELLGFGDEDYFQANERQIHFEENLTVTSDEQGHEVKYLLLFIFIK